MSDHRTTEAPDQINGHPGPSDDLIERLRELDKEMRINIGGIALAAAIEIEDLRFTVSGLNKDWNKALSRHDAMEKALRWMVDNPGAHPANIVVIAKDALKASAEIGDRSADDANSVER